jgi:hypothetical protein
MKRIIFLLWIFLFFPSLTWAQEKIEAPVWNVGDKWVFTQGNIEVVGADENTYTLNFKNTCIIENKGFEKIIFDKSTLNRIYGLKEDNREKYTQTMTRILNFPLDLGQEWKDTGTCKALAGPYKGRTFDCSETFKVLGWENVEVQAGNFKTIKLEYTQVMRHAGKAVDLGKVIYWYAPEVKYFVKCIYDKHYFMGIADWELVSFKLNK